MFDSGYERWHTLSFEDLHHMLVEDKMPWKHRKILQGQEMVPWILWLWRCWGWDLHAWENYSYSSIPYINSPSLIGPDLLWFCDFKGFPCFPWPASKMGLVEPLEGIMWKFISLCFSCTFGCKAYNGWSKFKYIMI